MNEIETVILVVIKHFLHRKVKVGKQTNVQ